MKKKSDSSENSCGGGGGRMWLLPPPPPSSPCSPTSQFEYDSMMNVDTTTHQTTLDYFENLHNSYSSSLLDDERSIISSSSNQESPQKLIGKNDEEAAEETSGDGITGGTETQGSVITTESDDVTLQELEVTKEEEVAVRNSVVVAAVNTGLAKEETVGGTEGATLGGSPIPSPSQHTDMHGDGSVSCAQGQRMDVVVGTSSVEQKGKSTPIKTKSAAAVEVLSSRSPTTSESGYDSVNATTHQTTRAFDNLHNSYSFSLFDNEEEDEDDEESISLVGVSIDVGKDFMTCCQFEFACPDNASSGEAKVSSDDVGRDSTICCQFESAFPDNVHDVNEILSTDLHSLTIQEELLLLNDWILLDETTGGDNTQEGEGGLGHYHRVDVLDDEQQGGDDDERQQQQQQRQSLNQQQGQPSTTQQQQQETRKSYFNCQQHYRRHNNNNNNNYDDNNQRGCHGITYSCVTFNEDDEVFVYDNNTTNNNNRLYSCNVGHEMSDMYNTNESSHKGETDTILAEVPEEDEEREAWGEGVNCCWI